MKIQIEENIFVESDGMQFILKKYTGKTDKKGNESYTSLGYFGSLQQALKFWIRKNVMDSNTTTFQEVIELVDKLDNKIESLLKI